MATLEDYRSASASTEWEALVLNKMATLEHIYNGV